MISKSGLDGVPADVAVAQSFTDPCSVDMARNAAESPSKDQGDRGRAAALVPLLDGVALAHPAEGPLAVEAAVGLRRRREERERDEDGDEDGEGRGGPHERLGRE